MRSSSTPGLAKRQFVNATRLARIAQGLLPKNATLAFASCMAVVIFAAGPQSAKDTWLQFPLSGAAQPDSLPGETTGSGLAASSLFAIPNGRATLQRVTFPAADPLHDNRRSIDRNRAAECLAAAAWYEAGNDRAGQRAVIQTVVNRVNNASFPNSICGVVFEGSELPTGCQFTFTCDGSLERRHPSAAAWKNALALSYQALGGYVDKTVGTATHYHAAYVNPWWSAKLERLTTVGAHIFYRWPGGKGTYPGQRRLGSEEDYDELRQRSITKTVPPQTAASIPGTLSRDQVPMNAPKAAVDQSTPSPRSAIFMALQENEASGRWALAAMKACKGQADCQVLGYFGRDQATRNQSGGVTERSRPIFLFIRDAASAMSIALWDCQRIDRPSESECLPTDNATLANLMRERRRMD